MSDIISKELLREVLALKYPIRIVHHFCKGQNVLNYDLRVECALFQESINIYELAHKCKEWAINEGYELKSSKPIVPNDEGKQVFNYWWMAWLFKFDGGYEAPQQVLLPSFIGKHEPEAIFKACQYILENKDKQWEMNKL